MDVAVQAMNEPQTDTPVDAAFTKALPKIEVGHQITKLLFFTSQASGLTFGCADEKNTTSTDSSLLAPCSSYRKHNAAMSS